MEIINVKNIFFFKNYHVGVFLLFVYAFDNYYTHLVIAHCFLYDEDEFKLICITTDSSHQRRKEIGKTMSGLNRQKVSFLILFYFF